MYYVRDIGDVTMTTLTADVKIRAIKDIITYQKAKGGKRIRVVEVPKGNVGRIIKILPAFEDIVDGKKVMRLGYEVVMKSNDKLPLSTVFRREEFEPITEEEYNMYKNK